MAQIVERIFTYVPGKALSLGGEQWARKISLGNQWSRIRMGFLGSMAGSASVAQAGYMLMGLSNSQVGGGTSVSGSAIGVSLSGSTITGPGAWTFTTNNGFPYYASNSSGKVFRRLPSFPGAAGPSIPIEAAASIGQVNIPATLGVNYAQRRSPVYFDITRETGGGGSATVAVYGFSTVSMGIDFRPDHFLEGLDNPGTPTLYGTAMTSLLSTTIPMSEMLGVLDTMFIMWARTSVPLELSAIGASISRPLFWDGGVVGGGADNMSAYNFVGTATAPILNQGSGFAAQGVFSGTYTNPELISGWAGTCGFGNDGFDMYAAGTVVSGVTLNAGTGWAAPGVV
jgi:hypothetical protein